MMLKRFNAMITEVLYDVKSKYSFVKMVKLFKI